MQIRLLFGAVCILGLATPPAVAQQSPPAPPRPGVVVVNLNKCAVDAPAKLDSLNAAAFFPVLDDMVREGKLVNWGVLHHLWGDEWNYVVYYSATSLTAFHAAFNEAFRRVNQRQPNLMKEYGALCSEHKDNIYRVTRLSVDPTPPR